MSGQNREWTETQFLRVKDDFILHICVCEQITNCILKVGHTKVAVKKTKPIECLKQLNRNKKKKTYTLLKNNLNKTIPFCLGNRNSSRTNFLTLRAKNNSVWWIKKSNRLFDGCLKIEFTKLEPSEFWNKDQIWNII